MAYPFRPSTVYTRYDPELRGQAGGMAPSPYARMRSILDTKAALAT